MKNFKELLVWQKAINFVTIIYKITDSFPESESFGLINQLRRAAVSIPSNIAEGCTRRSKIDFVQYLKIARGSAAEVETQIIISYNLKFINQNIYTELSNQIIEISKMLNGLISSLAKSTED
ncbi:four helix bundle protein [Elizabethkingia sp. HX XZB]|uniref:four helix bundle protein n=1 Tax=Elizabethkingia sp. HX XZB TaxID=3003193 RepID=UPI0029366FD5|nr:four helix bundle protein [Elizabethkingia sp. HX XZB]MDV2447906.1 four helix bundle protein [Elizabethkingia anophelis]MDX8569145.1 four helix bundle protein [Elizabethkingia sp. HX XZB]